MKTLTGTILLLLGIAFIIAVGPFLLIWSLNTLIPSLAIEYTFINFVAAFILLVLVQSKVKVEK